MPYLVVLRHLLVYLENNPHYFPCLAADFPYSQGMIISSIATEN